MHHFVYLNIQRMNFQIQYTQSFLMGKSETYKMNQKYHKNVQFSLTLCVQSFT